MASVLLCTDEPVLAAGLSQVLLRSGGLRLSEVCGDLETLSAAFGHHKPDILLLDLTSQPDQAQLDWIQQISPGTKIVLWVNEIAGDFAMQALSSGVRGVLRKTLPVETLLKCLTRVMEGELWFEKALTDSLMSSRRILVTPRENRLVVLLAQGLKNKEIARAMGIEEGSVKVYLSRLYRKLGVKDRYELALFGLKHLAPGDEATGGKTVRIARSVRGNFTEAEAAFTPTPPAPRRR